MARIRSLKPDHKLHRKIGPLTDRQYRLWVGMITEADDEGRLIADAGQLKLQVFGYQPNTKRRDVDAALLILDASGLIRLYWVGETRYACFPSWRDHQVINHRQTSNLPEYIHSRNGTGALPEPSGSIPGGRKDRKDRKEGSTPGGTLPEQPDALTSSSGSDAPPPRPQPTAEQQLDALAQRSGLTRNELKQQADDLAKSTAEAMTPKGRRR